ncbi:unnamed protein product [Echinostoma caproni]|uniref:Nop domain-containing protein n=1 Tax=Echinostoma caproni TaxID=27848 RepID=A0A3P8CTZ2_9TREM|nr:unnamed protein product [Echinostoma caproni]
MKKLLKKLYVQELRDDVLAIADKKLCMDITVSPVLPAIIVQSKMNIPTSSDSMVQNLMRAIRCHLDSLLPVVEEDHLTRMRLGLAHSLDRYKLKCNPDKIDTMIVQAVGHRENSSIDLSDLVPDDIAAQIREASIVSLGTEVVDDDIEMINELCDQVLEVTESRVNLQDYLMKRMIAVAPNLTSLVGELLGARLIARAGTLVNLAKHPSSTVQILGAEKALFRALKSNQNTPKYGLLYHAALINQADPKLKGKMSRMLAAKASLSARLDALGEEGADTEMGLRARAYLENRLRQLESNTVCSFVFIYSS